jgi:ABC-type multidrug transport system ATPase subunit
MELEMRVVRKTYRPRGGPAVAAVRDVDLAVAAGQSAGMLGPRGAGKTTMIRLLAGQIRPTSGTIRVRDYDLNTESAAVLGQIGALVPDQVALPGHRTPREHLLRIGRAHALEQSLLEARIEALLDETGLWASRNAAIQGLSPGQRRVVELASALVGDPTVILLDEPTRALDAAEARAVLVAIRAVSGGRTLVLATSHVAIACDLCERVVVLNNGRLVAEHTRNELLGLFRQERYVIRIKGHLSATWSDWFDGLTVVNEDGGEAVISGPIADQSALHGLLARIHALNLPLLNVSRVEPGLEDILTQLYGNA